MLKKILITIAAVVIIILGYAASKPSGFMVQRQITIKAKPEKIFAQINNLDNWKSWSPWRKYDKNMKIKLSGNEAGKGAISEWDGKGNAGKGRMEIIESVDPYKIIIRVDMEKPFKVTNTTDFTLNSNGNETVVSWALYGSKPYIGKLMSIFYNCEKMVGKDLEEGLTNLKDLVENKAGK